MKKLLSIFKKKNFRNLFLATFTSQMGSTIGMTAFMFYLLDRFGDQPAYATVTELMYSLPTLAVFFIVGVLADRMDRQKIASNCDWLSAFLSVIFVGAVVIGWMPLVFATLFLRSAISKFFYPAESALVQGILNKDEYATAAGLNQMTGSLFMLFGSALGALAYWYLGIEGAIIVDAVSFAASAIFIRTCKISKEVRLPNGEQTWKDIKVNSVMKDFKSGMVYILNHKLLLSLIFGFFIFGIVNGGLSVMPAFILKYKLAPETYEEMMVYVGMVFGSGVLIGSVVASVLANKVKLHHMVVIGLAVSGTFLGVSAIPNNLYLFYCLTFIAALALPFVNIAIGGWMPSIVDPKMMGRVQGWITPLMMLSQSITLGVIAVAYPKVITVEGLFWTVGGCLVLVAIFYAIMLPKYANNENDDSAELPVERKQAGTTV